MGRIEDVIIELKSLSAIKPLKGAQLSRFKELCIFLRKNGYTNSDIAALTDGAYSPVTIKEYTRGVKSANTAKRDEMMGLFSRLLDQGRSTDDVHAYFNLQEQLEKKGMSISSVLDFLKHLQVSEIEIDDIPSIREDLEALCRDGVSDEQISLLAQYANELNKMGLQPFQVRGIYDAAKKYGGSAQKVIEAIGAYENLQAIKNQTTVGSVKLQQVEQTVRQAENKLHEVEAKKTKFKKRSTLSICCTRWGLPTATLSKCKSCATQWAAPGKSLQL